MGSPGGPLAQVALNELEKAVVFFGEASWARRDMTSLVSQTPYTAFLNLREANTSQTYRQSSKGIFYVLPSCQLGSSRCSAAMWRTTGYPRWA